MTPRLSVGEETVLVAVWFREDQPDILEAEIIEPGECLPATAPFILEVPRDVWERYERDVEAAEKLRREAQHELVRMWDTAKSEFKPRKRRGRRATD